MHLDGVRLLRRAPSEKIRHQGFLHHVFHNNHVNHSSDNIDFALSGGIYTNRAGS